MGAVPDNRLGKVEFYEAHTPVWTTSATQIGLTPASVTALNAKVLDARKAYSAHLSAQDAVRAMHNTPGAGSDVIQTIKTFAQTSNNPQRLLARADPAPGHAFPVQRRPAGERRGRAQVEVR